MVIVLYFGDVLGCSCWFCLLVVNVCCLSLFCCVVVGFCVWLFAWLFVVVCVSCYFTFYWFWELTGLVRLIYGWILCCYYLMLVCNWMKFGLSWIAWLQVLWFVLVWCLFWLIGFDCCKDTFCYDETIVMLDLFVFVFCWLCFIFWLL